MSSSSDRAMKSMTNSTKPDKYEDIDGLPEASKASYMKAYNVFMEWRAYHAVQTFSEIVFSKYFSELSKRIMPATLWSTYTKLRATVNAIHKLDIKKYKKLKAFLKKQSLNVKSNTRTCKIFTAEDVETFLNCAPDETFLATKVVLIFGISGACTTSELSKISVDDVKKQEQCFLIDVRDYKNNVVRTFTVRDKFASLLEKYRSLRPENYENKRFFLRYVNGKCIKINIAKQAIGDVPKQIADFLGLPDSNLYTGNSFQKSTMHIAESGADVDSLKR